MTEESRECGCKAVMVEKPIILGNILDAMELVYELDSSACCVQSLRAQLEQERLAHIGRYAKRLLELEEKEREIARLQSACNRFQPVLDWLLRLPEDAIGYSVAKQVQATIEQALTPETKEE